MSLLNNWLELRSDAFKIAVHARRPIPSRTDTIGPWLDALSFLTWLAALANSALVYLFRPADQCAAVGTTLQRAHHRLAGPGADARALLGAAAVVALGASHAHLALGQSAPSSRAPAPAHRALRRAEILASLTIMRHIAQHGL